MKKVLLLIAGTLSIFSAVATAQMTTEQAVELRKKALTGDAKASATLSILQKTAEQGNAAAQTQLGMTYDGGKGVKMNEGEMVKWFRKAVDQGYAPAYYYLGLMYGLGSGVPLNYAEQFRLNLKGAEQGDAEAQTEVGNLYNEGSHIKKNQIEALKWFRKGAEQGHIRGLVLLGIIYEKGEIVTKNRVVSYALYNLSSANDLSATYQGASLRDELANKMTKREIDAAQALTLEMVKPRNFLVALDQYVKHPVVK